MLSLLVWMAASSAGTFDVVKDIPYGSKPGQIFDWYRPNGNVTKPTPVVVFQHGGHGVGDKEQLTEISPGTGFLPLLLDNGITVMAIDNQPFPQFVYPTQVEDAALAVQFFRANAAQYDIDPDRLAIWGWSSGSTIASLLCYGEDFQDPQGTGVAAQSSRPMAFLNWRGVTNWTIIVPWYPGTMFNKPTLADVDPLVLKEASGAEAVQCVARPFTPPLLSYFGYDESPIPLTNVHDATMGKDLHAEIANFPSAAADSVFLQTADWPFINYPELIEQVAWLRDRFGMSGPIDVGLALPGTLGEPVLEAGGSFAASGAYTFDMQASVSAMTVLLVFAGPPAFLGAMGGMLVPSPQIAVAVPTGSDGSVSLGGTIPASQPPAEIFMQFWHADPGAANGYAASNGLRIPLGG